MGVNGVCPADMESVDDLAARVGRRIRAARLERGLTLRQLGGRELSASFLSQVERGRSRISLRVLALVAGRLGLPPGYFIAQDLPLADAQPEEVADRLHAALLYSTVTGAQGHREEAIRYALHAMEMALDLHQSPA